jgi:CheY-like chemotaxis protein
MAERGDFLDLEVTGSQIRGTMLVSGGARFMAQETRLQKLLLVEGDESRLAAIFSSLQGRFDIQCVANDEELRRELMTGPVDAVVLRPEDVRDIELGRMSRQASAVLDQIGEGVCLFDINGELLWRNRNLRNAPQPLMDALMELCPRASAELRRADRRVAEQSRGKRYSLMPADGGYFEVICSPIYDSNNELQQIAAVLIDVTTSRRQQQKLNAIDHAARELVRIDSETIEQKDAAGRLDMLEERIIRCSKDVLQYHHFALLVLDPRTNKLDMIISEGLDDDGMEVFASTEGNGISGYVAATGRSYICPDANADPRYIRSLRHPGSCLTVPLRMHDRVIGVFHVESDRVSAFGEEDRQFAEIFANYVAIALNMLNVLTVERHTTHVQVSGSIAADLTGPLNDIISNASQVMEDYIGLDELRKQMSNLIDQATTARRVVQQWVQAPKTGVLPSAAARGDLDPILAGKRILVADDENLIRETITNVLEPCGCDVDQADNGQQALTLLAKHSYDLVISDIKMPGATGYDVFAAARQADENVAVILITAFGYDPSHSIVKANQEGLSAVMMKPFKVNDLLEQCRNAINGE